MTLSLDQLQFAYCQMHVIRKFEETVRELYQQGQIRGSFHPCVGQEATAAGAALALRADDYLTCTYRGHGHAIAKGLSVRAAMAEMLGKATGCSKGKGGSMHFSDPSIGLLGANAIVAGGVPHAAGAALAAQMQGTGQVAVAFFGEGAVNQGVFHETLNLAAIWKLPVIFICENNQYSEMTPSWETTSTSDTWQRAAAYGIQAGPVDGNDVEAMAEAVGAAAQRARAGLGASYLEAHTYRLWGHMMGDPEVYRSKQEVAEAWQHEPIGRLGRRLLGLGLAEADLNKLAQDAQDVVADALAFAQASPLPQPEEAFKDVFAPLEG